MTNIQEQGMRRLMAQRQSQAAQRPQGPTDVLDVADARQIAIQRLGSVASLASSGSGPAIAAQAKARAHANFAGARQKIRTKMKTLGKRSPY